MMRLLYLTTVLCCVYIISAQHSNSTSVSSTGGSAFASTDGGPQFDSVRFGNGSTSGVATASVSTSRPKSPSPASPTPPPFPVDFTTTEASLRTFIFQANVAGAARVLRSQRIVSLGAGLTYPPKLAPLVEPTKMRNEDPDVVAFKALAKSALETGEASKLATAVVLSFQPDCKCRVGSADELDEVRIVFEKAFSDKKAMREIVNADANRELTRRLLQAGKSPVTSFVCSACWPKNECRHLNWC